MTTVLVLNPMSTDLIPNPADPLHPYMGSLMRGSIAALGTLEKVNYTNQPGIANIIAGTATLHARLTSGRAPGEQFVVFGYSEGCQIASRWLRLNGPSLPIATTDIRFIFIGNATRKFGGFAYQHSVFSTVADIAGYPDATPYTVTDFCRQYDGVADFPDAAPIQAALASVGGVSTGNNYFNEALAAVAALLNNPTYSDAAVNAIDGMAWVHNWYFDITLADPANVSYTPLVSGVPGKVTYVYSPTYPLPLLAGWFWALDYQKQLDKKQRPGVEAAYHRPVVIPPPGYKPPAPPPKPLAAKAAALYSPDPRKAAAAAEALAAVKTALDDEWIVTVCDKLWRPIGAMGDDMMELTGTDPRNNVASATLKIKGDSTLWDAFAASERTMVGVTVETNGLRFAFYVDTFDEDYTEKGEKFGTAHLLGIWDILNYLVIFPLWFLPIQTQPISHAVYAWALCGVCESMIAECGMRIQSLIPEFINNALSLNPDIRAWFGSLLQSNGNLLTLLKTPLYVVRTNPFLDTSPLVVRTVRMETCGTVIQDITRAYGVDVEVALWLPGDDQPDVWANLDQPTYVVTVKDRAQLEGPTKTVADAVVKTVVDIGGSFFGNSIAPIVREIPGMVGAFDAPGLGLNFVPPWAILEAPEPGHKGSVVSCKISHHTPKGWQHIIGGRSPKWLNDVMNATFAWLIDSVSILIGISGIPSNLLEGFLNNAYLAFQLVELYDRRNDVGPYHPAIEVMHPTASSPYNIETLFAFINAFWDTRGYVSAQATFRNGEVLTLGKDVFRGGLASVLYNGRRRLFTDYIDLVFFRLTPTARDVMLQIGDGKKEEAPLAKLQRSTTGVFEAVSVLTLAPQA